MSAWLRGEDKVREKGGPSWSSLATALDKEGKHHIATNIRDKYYPNGVSTPPTGGTSTGREVVAIGDYTAQYSDELTFSEGEILQILEEVDDNWYHGVCQDKVGIFPKTYVREP
ncbi:PREDICTED: abl interactor 2-like [Amphimedon queenslandica]|nr:PREDICTED: abl interactor 2-like [Amphimedon queenslandica]|eukprot:XP_019862058.1 PREDICTED: abl interactor 2-like [Amphimedon queenslandica]